MKGLTSRQGRWGCSTMELLGAALTAAGVVHIASLLRLCRPGARGKHSWRGDAVTAPAAGIAAWAAARLVTSPANALGITTIVVFLTLAYVVVRRRDLLPAGAAVWSSWVLFGAASAVWTLLFIIDLDVSTTTRVLLLAGVPFVMIGLPASIVTQRESLEVLIRRRWRRQSPPLLAIPAAAPLVSIHVPCHAEPPEVVIGTLDCLAALEYPRFEVVVIDNNTTDERLWRPVEAHCAKLGSRFRFLHVEGITGAKAGALNWGRRYADPEADLIAVVDADYHVAPGWLRATVGYFTDPTVGFVQPPHAYRGWRNRRFLRWANWEYSMFFATGMVALQEHGAGITVGTLSVIRARALDDAGGWAQWCLTEDSELAIRIHALGYRSIYLTEPLGWGLIPETFDAYRRQRFRWTYGPVQELRRHWRKFLPRRVGGAPRYTLAQRLHHANHGFDVAMVGVRLLAWPFGIAAALSLVAQHEHVPVPLPLWAASTVMLVSGLLIRWMQYVKVTGASLSEAVGAIVVYQALTHAITTASLRAGLGLSASWHRTSKFSVRSHRPLATTRAECAIGTILLAIATLIFAVGHNGLALMLGIGVTLQAFAYLSAPIVAIIASRDLSEPGEHYIWLDEPEPVLEELSA
jgi:glycosyltransferase involved in cell wall biosynthesis